MLIAEHKLGMERIIKIPWNNRNIIRINKWLKLELDHKGFFGRNGKRIGYKTDGRWLKYMFYHFPEYPLDGVNGGQITGRLPI